MSDEVGETVNENQKLATQEEQITKPAPKVKPQREKDPKKVAAGKKLAEKNRQAKAALEREIKREIAEKEQENENSAGWLPEMSFQTVLSIVGIAFTAFELYQRFRQKESSVSVQSTISPRAEPKHSGGDRESGEAAGAKLGAERSDSGATAELEKAKRRRAKPREAPSVQKSEWCERIADQRSIIYFFLTTKMSEQNKLVKMVTDSAVLVGLTAGVGYLAKKILKENFLGDPSSNVMNYAKFTGVLAGSMALKTYLEDQKILPKSI